MMPPKIDHRNKNDLIVQMKEIVPFYTPEWRFTPENPDPGSALFLTFAEMFMGNIQRMNRVPLKHFVGFLNMLDISLHNAQSATAFVTFNLTNGAKDSVFIKKGTKMAAKNPDGGDDIIFESADHLLVTPAKIAAIYKACPNRDSILKVPEELTYHTIDQVPQELEPVGMYHFKVDENLQEHSLYLSHENFFTVTSTVKIEIGIHNPFKSYKDHETAKLLADPTIVDWCYYANDEWYSFDKVEFNDNKLLLYKTQVRTFAEKEVEDDSSKWIRCTIKEIKKDDHTEEYSHIEIGELSVKTDYYDFEQTQGFFPDLIFNDDLHLDEKAGFYPFTDFFNPYSNFYISSEEAFSKKGSRIVLRLHLKSVLNHMKTQFEQEIDWKLIMKESKVKKPEVQNIMISKVNWEYWNGNSWVLLPVDQEYNDIFTTLSEEGEELAIEFDCPLDFEKTFVNSDYNFWIRVRILHIDSIFSAEVLYHSPWIENLRISYESINNASQIEKCVTYNNLNYRNEIDLIQTSGFAFHPFRKINSRAQAFYLGFDQPPLKGPISLFFNFVDYNFTEFDQPSIEWEYLRKNGDRFEWAPFKVIDQTNSLTRSGVIRFFGPDDFALQDLFSQNLYWIRIVNYNRNSVASLHKTPTLKSIHLNTGKVIEQVSIERENPIEIEEGYDKIYQLANYPVLTETVWVDESGHVSEDEMVEIGKKEPDSIAIIRDTDHQIQKCWIKWQATNQFFESTPYDRHYVINRSLGKIYFGNGSNGRRPADLTMDKIMVDYNIGGGKKGNVTRYEINTLQSSIPFIDTLINFEPGGGGADQEILESALVRGPQMFKHLDRAVTTEDFEWLVREASQNIAKVKCLSNYNALMKKEIGTITIVILPESGVEGLQSFPEIKAKVEKYILSHTAATIAFPEKIQVIKPAFIEISLSAILVVEDMEMLVDTEIQALKKLNSFLDPLTGNFDQKGWEIGQQIHISLFYALLKSIRYVNFVERLYMTVHKIENGERFELDINEAIHIPHGIIVNGIHTIKVKVL